MFTPSDLNLRADFTTVKTVQNPNNGNTVKKPVTLFTKWAGWKTRGLTQQYLAMGTEVADTIVIGVRHDPRINKTLGVTLKGTNYNVVNVSPDDSNHYIAFDLVTIKEVTK